MELQTCPFCEIVAGKQEGVVVYQDDMCLAIMDRFPLNKGHILIIPKKHYTTIFDIPELLVGTLFTKAWFVARVLVRAVKADGVHIGQNNGRAANQKIDHVHIHIIPRFNDDIKEGGWPKRRYLTNEELETTAKLIRYEVKAVRSNRG